MVFVVLSCRRERGSIESCTFRSLTPRRLPVIRLDSFFGSIPDDRLCKDFSPSLANKKKVCLYTHCITWSIAM